MIGQVAARAVRRAIESTYKGNCTVYQYQELTEPETCLTRKKKVVLYERCPCHLSFESANAAQEGGGAALISQSVKLFCAPELNIRPGAIIEVMQNGRTEVYKRSGKGAVYASHQEIPLALADKYA